MKIMLDAGHGPETPGKRTTDGKMEEFEFNQAVVQFIKKELDNCEVISYTKPYWKIGCSTSRKNNTCK